MTKLLYVPSGDYITFSEFGRASSRTTVFEDSTWIADSDINTVEIIVNRFCSGELSFMGEQCRNPCLSFMVTHEYIPNREEFEIIYD